MSTEENISIIFTQYQQYHEKCTSLQVNLQFRNFYVYKSCSCIGSYYTQEFCNILLITIDSRLITKTLYYYILSLIEMLIYNIHPHYHVNVIKGYAPNIAFNEWRMITLFKKSRFIMNHNMSFQRMSQYVQKLCGMFSNFIGKKR